MIVKMNDKLVIRLPWAEMVRKAMEQKRDSDEIINMLLDYADVEEDRINEYYLNWKPDKVVLGAVNLKGDKKRRGC